MRAFIRGPFMLASGSWRRIALCVGCILFTGLVGCEPPKMPATGGLVSTQNPDSQTPQIAITEPTSPPSSLDPVQVAGAPIEDQSLLANPEFPPPGGPTASANSKSPPAASTAIAANPGLIPVDQIGKAAAPGQGRPQGTPASAASTAAPSGVPPIHLSAGIAVPQSLPTGTQMGVSVDYAIRGALNRSSRYVLVVSSDGGGDVEAEVRLAVSGTFQDFVPKLRPDDRPFNCRIDEITPGGRRVRASNVAPLQTNY